MNLEKNKNGIVRDKDDERRFTAVRLPVRCSVLAKKLVIKGENRKEFEELRAKMLEEMLPNTEMEKILFERIISAAWKLRRVAEIEKNLLNSQNAITDQERYMSSQPRERVRNIEKVRLNGAEVQYLVQYQLDLEKSLQKALERFRAEQALRNAQGTTRI